MSVRRGGDTHGRAHGHRSWPGLVALAVALLAAGCSPPPTDPGGGTVVQADVFSGRPNPEWALRPGEAGELGRLFGELSATRDTAPLYGGLGYRGFVVFGPGDAIPGCDEVRVQRERVVARCGGSDRWYADPERTLERWLAATAEGRADPQVARLLREQTGG